MSLHQEHLSSLLCRAGWVAAHACSSTQSRMHYSRYSLWGWCVSSLFDFFPRTSTPAGTIWSWWILKGARKELGRQCDLAVKGKEMPKRTDSLKIWSLWNFGYLTLICFSCMCKKNLFHIWGARRGCWGWCSIMVSVGVVGLCARCASQFPCPGQRGSELPKGITGSALELKLWFLSFCVECSSKTRSILMVSQETPEIIPTNCLCECRIQELEDTIINICDRCYTGTVHEKSVNLIFLIKICESTWERKSFFS